MRAAAGSDIVVLVAPAAIPVPPETSPEFTTFTVAAAIPKERAPLPVATALMVPELFTLAEVKASIPKA